MPLPLLYRDLRLGPQNSLPKLPQAHLWGLSRPLPWVLQFKDRRPTGGCVLGMWTHRLDVQTCLYMKSLRGSMMRRVGTGGRLWVGSLHLYSCSKTCKCQSEPVFDRGRGWLIISIQINSRDIYWTPVMCWVLAVFFFLSVLLFHFSKMKG